MSSCVVTQIVSQSSTIIEGAKSNHTEVLQLTGEKMRSQDASTNPTKEEKFEKGKGEGKYRLTTGRQIMVEVRKEKWHQRNKREKEGIRLFSFDSP
ncbi:hypothetical protein CEXT_577041 [Caerostris extrusa]|uniref:Uncharacterized protein n=1 Tax=Caerostris extrusa TaxID=172846 RepID=A0AAV4NQL6_CAEEX|nr:hypothetical protein CEXT_577041 [Caerostris extrusa]